MLPRVIRLPKGIAGGERIERKRLVDFSSGLVFGLHGRIERISLKVFLLSPANVSVSNEDKTAAQATFFNQS